MNMKLAAAAMLVALTIGITINTSTANAQLSRGHKLIDSRMAPGVASQRTLMGNKNLQNHVQPVRLLTPEGSSVGIFANGTTISASNSAVSVGVTAGLLYRFKVDFVVDHQPRTVYPSIELLDRLYPPQGLETQFPIPVVLTQDDLEQSSSGKMVTKVIYLESAEGAVVRRASDREQPYFDVDGAEDPLHVAKGFGKPLVILRIGSRIPTQEELHQPSAFNSSVPVNLPDPIESINSPAKSVSPTAVSTRMSDQTTRMSDQTTRMSDQTTRFSDQTPLSDQPQPPAARR